MQALEHSLTELADRSSGTSRSKPSSAEVAQGNDSGSAELKELKSRIVHLEYDIKSKEDTIRGLRAQQQQQQQPAAGPISSSEGGVGVEEMQAQIQTLQHSLAAKVEAICNLEQVTQTGLLL
jgi:predicted RNase H-like nuclease (RuvC/YqgF family)